MKKCVDGKKENHHKQVVKKQKQMLLAKNRAKFNVRTNLHTIIENGNNHILLIDLTNYNLPKDSSKTTRRIF